MSRRDRMIAALEARLAPTALEVRDVSGQHYGHAGWREGGETHFEVDIASPLFEGLSRVSVHRLVHEALGEELAGGLHAVQIRVIKDGGH